MENKLTVISLGGSLIVPDQIDTLFLTSFKSLIVSKISEGHKFILITGGGKVCRRYQDAASQVTNLTDNDKDWIGIHSTRLNAHLIRTIFREYAYPVINKNPNSTFTFEKYFSRHNILVASGWKPGRSTDYIAVKLAAKFNADKVINLSNIDYVYNKDPNKFSDATKLENISWKDYKKMVGKRWSPGLNSPFDPIASRLADRKNIKVYIASGNNLENIDSIIESKSFVGTLIC